MSEHEFEAYLNLLARTLRLSPRQRDRIAGELRDHMEQRLDELTAAGVERHDAALQALDEFGDATALATELSDSAREKKRRHLMQTTFATAAVAAAVTLGVMYLAPSNYQGRPSQPFAAADQAESAPTPDTARTEPAPQKRVDARFEDSRLEDVIGWFADQLDVNLHVDWNVLELAGVERDLPVSMGLSDVNTRVAFELMLRTLPTEARLSYEVVDERLWLLTTADHVRPEIVSRGYDLTHLIELRRNEILDRPNPRSGRSGRGTGMGGRMGMGDMGGGFGMGGMAPESFAANDRSGSASHGDVSDRLGAVIVDTLPRDTWMLPGTGVVVFDGVAVVRQTEANHREIEKTLDMLTMMLKHRAEELRDATATPSSSDMGELDFRIDELSGLHERLRRELAKVEAAADAEDGGDPAAARLQQELDAVTKEMDRLLTKRYELQRLLLPREETAAAR